MFTLVVLRDNIGHPGLIKHRLPDSLVTDEADALNAASAFP